MKAINWAREHTELKDMEIAAILNARNTFLFKNNQSWVKKEVSEEGENFDVSMGSMDSSECSDLVGLYILAELSKFIEKDSFGLYKDNGLLAIKDSGPNIEKIKKQIIAVFKSNDMKIEIGNTCMRTDFLDLEIDLEKSTYEPFCKPNHDIKYIDANSNHPPVVKRNLPGMIEKRISNLSCSKEVFDKHKSKYINALKESGFKNFSFEYQENKTYTKKNRKRNILWYTPPFSENVKTKIGGTFFYLLQKHFPKDSALYKLINKSNVKLSYSCVSSMRKIISSINNSKIKKSSENAKKHKQRYKTMYWSRSMHKWLYSKWFM